jgi:hypothetical protein
VAGSGTGGRSDVGEGAAQHAVFERDGWRCTVPGCSSYRNLHVHPVVFRSQSGANDASNLTTLSAPHALRFELGRMSYGPGEVRTPSPT